MYNQTTIVGNLGGDPELKYLDSGVAVCNFSVATTEYWRDRQTNEKREKTTWFRVNVWGVPAENANKYLQKGSKVLVTGTVGASAYMNKEGEAIGSLDLRATDVKYLSSRSDDSPSNSQQSNDPATNPNIPF